MTGPAALSATMAVLMLAIAVYCAARIVAAPVLGRGGGRDADMAHTAMAAAMAGMLLPWLNPLPAAAWIPVFAAGAAWFAWQACRQAPRLARFAAAPATPHLAHNAAMLYMLTAAGTLTASPGTAMSGMHHPGGPAALPVLGLALAAIMLAYAITDTDLLSGPAPPQMLSPRLARLCRIALGITMSYMLIITV